MDSRSSAAEAQDTIFLNIYCSKVGGEDDMWRVHVRPTWLPRYLHQFFDRHGEAYPALLDWEDLDRFMTQAGADYEKRVSQLGGVELMARGRAAGTLAQWLATAFASGVR